MTEFVYAEKSMVRIDGKVPAIVHTINMTKGETTVWTSSGMRTVVSTRIGPAKTGDKVERTPVEGRAPTRKKGDR